MSRPPPEPYAITQSNTVVRGHIDAPILNWWAAHVLNGKCRQQQFQSTLAYCKVLKNLMLAFPSGKVVVCGSHSEWDALLRVLKLALLMQRDFGVRARPIGLETSNVVGSASLGYRITLKLMEYDYPLLVNGERFRGMHFYPPISDEISVKLAFIIFETGKFIITGGRSRLDLRIGYDYMLKILPKYRQGHEYREFVEVERAAIAAAKDTADHERTIRKEELKLKKKRVYKRRGEKRKEADDPEESKCAKRQRVLSQTKCSVSSNSD